MNLNYIFGYQGHSHDIINSLSHCSWNQRLYIYIKDTLMILQILFHTVHGMKGYIYIKDTLMIL
jgi:hypothetical protein